MEIHVGDCRQVLATLPEKSVQCVVTSPPYWGLRDYKVGDAGIGLEKTFDAWLAAMVEVFRGVRRVLRDDGTVWLNIGDAYAQGGKMKSATERQRDYEAAVEHGYNVGGWSGSNHIDRAAQTDSLVPTKNMLGMPWRLAFALQQPYYTGSIKDERDRIWLAAILEAEGCLFIHKRKAGQPNGQGYHRTIDNFAPGVEIANTNREIIERVMQLVGKGSICTQGPEQNARRKQRIYRWNLRTTECREFVRELYPHIVGKRQQARILIGCPSSGAQAESAHAALIALHNGHETRIDFPAPESMFEPGWYLRSDVIWWKPNPMPESVTDRPTKSHEYVFLLTKKARYFYDAEAVREKLITPLHAPGNHERPAGNGQAFDDDRAKAVWGTTAGRNLRSVWSIPTQSFRGAHFATYPEKLVAHVPEGRHVVQGLLRHVRCPVGAGDRAAAGADEAGRGYESDYRAAEV